MPKILNVGQCGYDHSTIARFLLKDFRADVVGAETSKDAIEVLREKPFDLVLVNRISDADGSSGLELIRAMKADPALAQVPVMLVSNYADAQQQAEALGALPGFGKADMNKAKAQERLRSVLPD